MNPRAAHRAAGLTLVELLVVIVLTALVATLVMQGIGQGLGLFRRVSADQGEIYRELMSRAWLRETFSTAAANPPDRDEFIADELGVRLMTYRPLLGSEGIATEISWTVRPERGLDYLEHGQHMAVAALPAVRGFEYQDVAGLWHPRWPVEDGHALPERVRIVFADGEQFEIALVTQRAPFFHSDEMLIDDE